jgi:hypothetical protein
VGQGDGDGLPGHDIHRERPDIVAHAIIDVVAASANPPH